MVHETRMAPAALAHKADVTQNADVLCAEARVFSEAPIGAERLTTLQATGHSGGLLPGARTPGPNCTAMAGITRWRISRRR